jgi:hypothetical protein
MNNVDTRFRRIAFDDRLRKTEVLGIRLPFQFVGRDAHDRILSNWDRGRCQG